MKSITYIVLILVTIFSGCQTKNTNVEIVLPKAVSGSAPVNTEFDKSTKSIHIIVALCDNKNQGIVPVPAIIGNGQDPYNNLYWGTAYGVKTYFKRSKDWRLIESFPKDDFILERIIFKHKTKNYYIVADAYDGQFIKKATTQFLKSSLGIKKDTLHVDNTKIGINGNSKLVAYIGHNGLMDFSIDEKLDSVDNSHRDIIILACFSKSYFKPYFESTNINPLVWTTGLMAPEAYTIHDAILGYMENESNENIRLRAAKAYAKYQKCNLKAAKNLLVTN